MKKTLALVALAALAALPVQAADLGGNCCGDLEDRIAELEATTARKGNRKATLNVYGQVNKALIFYDLDGASDQQVIDNSASSSFVGFAGKAQISPDWSAGYVLEIGVGGYDNVLGGVTGDTNDIFIQRSYVWTKGQLGALSVGLTSQATDEMDLLTTANTGVAVRPLSLRPLTGPQLGESLDLFDGNRGNVVRYDSPTLAGFVASASWGGGEVEVGDDTWDVALRYAGEWGGFKVLGGLGYREGIIVNDGGSSLVLNFGDDFELQTFTATGSVMHAETGLFVTVLYGQGDGSTFFGDFDTEGLSIVGGIERKWWAIGKTSIFGEYGQVEITPDGGPAIVDVDYYGGGIVQAIENGALDIYGTIRQYDGLTNDDATVGMVGARIRF